MQTTLRPFATASVALVGASAIAISPVALEPTLPDIKVANSAVNLTAAVDPITPWLETFNIAEMNFADLANAWLEAPAPVVQQVIANQIRYLSQLPDFPVILEQMVANLGAAIQAPFATDPSTLENTNPLLNHRSLFTILSELANAGASPLPPELQPLIDFSTTYTSGILLGLVGPVVGPVLALAASANAVLQNLTGEDPDLAAALNTLVNTPAAMVDAFLNGGQTLDLTPVLDALGLDLDPAPGTDVTDVGITFGGLLSPGGSIFNALEFDITIAGIINVNIPGQGPGFIGSLIGLSQTIAKAIGWDGVGNPLAPPLETPEADLRQADDTSLLAARTVTLETSQRAVEESDAPADETDASTSEPSTTPAVSTTDETEEEAEVNEPSGSDESEEATSEDADEAASEETEESEDSASEDADESATDESEDSATGDVDNGSDESSDPKSGQNGSSDSGSSDSDSKSSDSASNS